MPDYENLSFDELWALVHPETSSDGPISKKTDKILEIMYKKVKPGPTTKILSSELTNSGSNKIKQGLFQEAIKDFERSIELDDTNILSWRHLYHIGKLNSKKPLQFHKVKKLSAHKEYKITNDSLVSCETNVVSGALIIDVTARKTEDLKKEYADGELSDYLFTTKKND